MMEVRCGKSTNASLGTRTQTLGFMQDHLEEYRKLVKDGKFVCRACGRVAAEEGSLCMPEKL